MTSRLAAAGAAGFSLKLAGAALAFLVAVLLARLLGPSEFGAYSVAYSLATLAGALAGVGLPLLVTKEVAACSARNAWGELQHVVASSSRRTIIAGAMAAVLAAAILLVADVGRHLSFWGACTAAVLVPVVAFNALRAAIIRGLGHPVVADTPDLLVQPALILIVGGAAYATSASVSAGLVLCWQLAAALAAMCVGYALLRNRIPVRARTATTVSDGDAWMRGAGASLTLTGAALLESQLALYMLSWLGGAEQAGHFQAARQVVSLVSVGLVGVNLPLQAKLAAAWAAGDRDEAQQLTTTAARISLAVAIAAAIVLVPLAGVVLGLYGNEYRDGADALRILVLGQLLNAAAGPCGVVLAMTGHVQLAPAGILLAIAANSLAGFALIPHFGATGAALAAFAGLLTWNAIFAYRARRATGLVTPALWWRRRDSRD